MIYIAGLTLEIYILYLIVHYGAPLAILAIFVTSW